MAILPFELLDILIDILKHDRPALNALALTHTRLAPRAQQRIFAHITLSGEQDDTDNANSILLALTHTKHAHLLTHVRALTLINHVQPRGSAGNSHYVPNHLIPVFIDRIAHQLSSLVLRGFAPGWDHEASAPLRSSISRLLASPQLTRLDLNAVSRFPIALLNHASTLTHFRFATMYPSHTPVPGTAFPHGSNIYLDTLDIDLWGEGAPCSFIEWILGDSRLSVARLRKLSINGAYTRQVALSFWKLLDECHSTLRHLCLGPGNFSYESYNTLHNLHSLRTLQLEMEMICHRLLDSNSFSFPIYILNGLPSPSALHQLDLLVRYAWWGDLARFYKDMDMSSWDALASFILCEIQRGKFAQLECICVGVSTGSTNPDIVKPQDIFPMIKGNFATLLQNSAISLEFFELV